jgi:hypothetical protein
LAIEVAAAKSLSNALPAGVSPNEGHILDEIPRVVQSMDVIKGAHIVETVIGLLNCRCVNRGGEWQQQRTTQNWDS